MDDIKYNLNKFDLTHIELFTPQAFPLASISISAMICIKNFIEIIIASGLLLKGAINGDDELCREQNWEIVNSGINLAYSAINIATLGIMGTVSFIAVHIANIDLYRDQPLFDPT